MSLTKPVKELPYSISPDSLKSVTEEIKGNGGGVELNSAQQQLMCSVQFIHQPFTWFLWVFSLAFVALYIPVILPLLPPHSSASLNVIGIPILTRLFKISSLNPPLPVNSAFVLLWLKYSAAFCTWNRRSFTKTSCPPPDRTSSNFRLKSFPFNHAMRHKESWGNISIRIHPLLHANYKFPHSKAKRLADE